MVLPFGQRMRLRFTQRMPARKRVVQSRHQGDTQAGSNRNRPALAGGHLGGFLRHPKESLSQRRMTDVVCCDLKDEIFAQFRQTAEQHFVLFAGWIAAIIHDTAIHQTDTFTSIARIGMSQNGDHIFRPVGDKIEIPFHPAQERRPGFGLLLVGKHRIHGAQIAQGHAGGVCQINAICRRAIELHHPHMIGGKHARSRVHEINSGIV